jgi:hypothetical protein
MPKYFWVQSAAPQGDNPGAIQEAWYELIGS